jgi:hypothetical protein
MKPSRTYVFVFLSVLLERIAHGTVAPSFSAGSNGSFPPDHRHKDNSRWLTRQRQEFEAQVLPSHLFWTWFVDNPRARS